MRRSILITGSSGIAEATARLAADEGWQVFFAGKERSECEALAMKLPGSGFHVGDLAEEATVDQAFAACLERFSKLDAVFAVAGMSGRQFGDGPVDECSLAGWEATFARNARPSFLTSRAAVRFWLREKRPGALLNMASVLAFSPQATHFATHAYAASKGAVIAMSKAMAAHYAVQGIRVNVLAPGLVKTQMSARAQSNEEISAFIKTKQPLSEGFLDAQDIARTALFLLSDQARHITGQVITVDGGWTVTG